MTHLAPVQLYQIEKPHQEEGRLRLHEYFWMTCDHEVNIHAAEEK